ncbi:class I SAM-dependent DNA methyltransferase [Gracilimonas mengyeensis]|uniref:Methyltransferase domain-containing protein n=1 Tax=Gracilimonas mengyeensis TaxID=1302730 RepID=A0A521D8E8_9BACT|nr:class I SAM-dependent methyltransferase [Gracilimonas mengyeensis]SMO67882.1 Methyltransferase domain-containing protein [Gracilimonas mengyeensis]
MSTKKANIYSVLAHLYDTLMEDVDYEMWADFIDEVILTHHPKPDEVLELACGTGAISLNLARFDEYHLTATDQSLAMIQEGRRKAKVNQLDVEFRTMDFRNIHSDHPFDIIFSVFDSVNYLHSKEEIMDMLMGCYKILNPGGLLIFDFSTPQNSLEAVDYLNNEEGMAGKYRYFRESRYEPDTHFHFNEFDIEELGEDRKTVINRYKEVHKQRIYTLQEMLSIVEQTPYHQVAAYEGFDLIPANDKSTRVTMVLRWQKQQ